MKGVGNMRYMTFLFLFFLSALFFVSCRSYERSLHYLNSANQEEVAWLQDACDELQQIDDELCELQQTDDEIYESQNQDIDTTRFSDSLLIRTQTITSSGGIAEFKLQFPFLVCSSSSDVIIEVNRAIHELVVSPFGINEFKSFLEMIEVTYEITYIDERLISVHFSGFVGWSGFADIQKAITIDLSTRRVLSLGDFFSLSCVEEIVANKIISDSAIVTNQILQESERMRLDYLNHMQEYFYNFLQRGDLLDATNNFYLRENRLGLMGFGLLTSREKGVFEIELEYVSWGGILDF